MERKAEKDANLAVSYSCGDIGGKSSETKITFELQNLAQARPCGDGPIKRGPDFLEPADNLVTCNPEEPVRLRMEKDGPSSETPESIMTTLRRIAENFPNHAALVSKVNGSWNEMTYQEYYNCVIIAAKAMIRLGLQVSYGVGIIGFNSAEWFISNLAAVFAGGLSTGIYASNSPEACRAIANDARCNILFVENEHQLQKILLVRDQLPYLKAIVQYKGQPSENHPDVIEWNAFLALGRTVPDELLQQRFSVQAPNKCCTLIFTSGTCGDSKGVMLSHDNLIWTAKMVTRSRRMGTAVDIFISYLPLSHIAAQLIDIYCSMVTVTTVYFAEPDALKGSLGKTMKEVRPTMFAGVPRVWEKIQEKMMAIGKRNGSVKRWISSWARDIGLRGNHSLMNKGDVPRGWNLADRLVFRKVRKALGLDRCDVRIVTGAPVRKETLEFFMSLNIPISEIYGMSECSGPHTMSNPWDCRFTSAGKEIFGCQTKLDIGADEGSESGEICIRGRNVCMGYLHNMAETRATFDSEGWLHSGDTARKDADGFVFITGRLKELLITAGGENVAPVPIEMAVKEQLPCISNCIVIGDQRKFLSMLITLETGLNPETNEPSDVLMPSVREWCRGLGSDASTVSEILHQRNGSILQAIQDGIDRANKQARSHAQLIQKWRILPRDFAISTGELETPPMAQMIKEECDKDALIQTGDGGACNADLANRTLESIVGRHRQVKMAKPDIPKPPKKPLTPYMMFSKETWPQVKATNSHLSSVCEIGAIVGALWRDLDPNEKQRYNELFAKDKERYDAEVSLYLRTTGLQTSDLIKPKQKHKNISYKTARPPYI